MNKTHNNTRMTTHNKEQRHKRKHQTPPLKETQHLNKTTLRILRNFFGVFYVVLCVDYKQQHAPQRKNQSNFLGGSLKVFGGYFGFYYVVVCRLQTTYDET